MNQIININSQKKNNNLNYLNNTNKKAPKTNSSKKIFNIQFFLSIIAICIITSIFLYYKISLNHKEDFSNLLINNYNITQLYSTHADNISPPTNRSPDTIIGIIEIPSINVSYPIFNELNDELLKTSPCRFYGNFPSLTNMYQNTSNLCIAGHNYNNSKFFSNIEHLDINDKIFLYDTLNNKYTFSVIKNYEVKSNDLSPVYNTITDSFELTLVTCNNFNRNRIIVKAKIEDG